MDELVFLKLGGSLITDKTRRYTPRLDKLRSLAAEIGAARREMPGTRLLLGHGSGSFGHYAVQEHLDVKRFPPAGRPRSDLEYWNGFAEVWYRASELNSHVIEALRAEGVAAVSQTASSSVTTSGGQIRSWDITSVRAALESGVLPVIYGDIVFDDVFGGKVLSTEALMRHLAEVLKPSRILLAGLEAAVWSDFPQRASPVRHITPASFPSLEASVGRSDAPDVTGGMRAKVVDMLELIRNIPELRVTIFSGEEEGNIRRAISGAVIGTVIAGD